MITCAQLETRMGRQCGGCEIEREGKRGCDFVVGVGVVVGGGIFYVSCHLML